MSMKNNGGKGERLSNRHKRHGKRDKRSWMKYCKSTTLVLCEGGVLMGLGNSLVEQSQLAHQILLQRRTLRNWQPLM